jgi:hypothetical protein
MNKREKELVLKVYKGLPEAQKATAADGMRRGADGLMQDSFKCPKEQRLISLLYLKPYPESVIFYTKLAIAIE